MNTWTGNFSRKSCHKCGQIFSTKYIGWIAISDHTVKPMRHVLLCGKCAVPVLAAVGIISENAMFDPVIGKIKGTKKKWSKLST